MLSDDSSRCRSLVPRCGPSADPSRKVTRGAGNLVPKLTKSFVDRIETPMRRATFWDDALHGFGVRVTPAGAKSFVIRYRVGGGGRGATERLHTLGRYGHLTVEEARQLAKAGLGAVANGGDPASDRAKSRAAIPVRELVQRYMDNEVRPTKKASTAALYQLYFDKHILPELGTKKAIDVTRADVAKLHREIGETAPPTANRVLVTLSGAYTWGASEGEIPAGINPCVGITRFKEEGRERFLSDEEMVKLGASLALAETEGLPWSVDEEKPGAKHAPKPENRKRIVDRFSVAAIRLLLFTGCRLREILHLCWDDVDLERGFLFLPDSKTGKKAVVLNAPAMEILSKLPHVGRFVIAGKTAGQKDEKPRADLHRPWQAVIQRAGLDGLRLHDLRHTHASVGAGAGIGLAIIGKLLGHRQTATTARYAHLAADPLKKASDQIADKIAAALNGSSSAEVIPISDQKGAA